MIHYFLLQCYPQLGTQPNLIQQKRYQIPFSFSLREFLVVWHLHENEPLSVTDTYLIPSNSLVLISFILIL